MKEIQNVLQKTGFKIEKITFSPRIFGSIWYEIWIFIFIIFGEHMANLITNKYIIGIVPILTKIESLIFNNFVGDEIILLASSNK